MTFVLDGRRHSGKLLLKSVPIKRGSAHSLQALFPRQQRLLLVRRLLRKSCALRPLLLLPALQEGRLRGGGGLGMHLVLRPVRLPLLPLDLGPARGVEVSLVAHPVRASAPLSPRLLRELGRVRLLVRSGLPLPAPLPRLPLPAHHSTLCDVVSRESLRRSAPVLDPPVFPDLRIEEQGRIAGPALGRPALVTSPVVLVFALLTASGQERRRRASSRSLSSRERSRRDRSRSSDSSRSRRDPRMATGLAEIAFNVIDCGLQTVTDCDNSTRDLLLVEEVAVTVRGHVRGLLPPLTARDQRREDGVPDLRSKRVWRQLLSPRLLLSLRRLLQWLLLLEELCSSASICCAGSRQVFSKPGRILFP